MEAHLYEEMARVEEHHWWFRGRRAVILAVMQQHLEPRPSRRILDVGCGTGGNLAALRQFGHVEGLDHSEEALRFCRARLGPDFPLHRGELPGGLPEGRFDVVTAFDVLEHLPDPVSTLRAICQVLEPDGTLVCAVPAFPFLWSAHDEVHHHQRRYTLSLLRQQLAEAGLCIRWSSYFNSLLFPPIAAVRLLQRLGPKQQSARSDVETGGPEWANRLLETVFSAERFVVPRFSLPAGVSLLVLASPEDGGRVA
jgi:SAM-dependent methyltransferase